MRRKSSVQQECACTPLITSEKFLSNTASSTPLGHWPGGGLTAADTQRSCPEVGVFVPAGEGGAHEAVTSEDGGAGGAHSCIFVGEQAGGGSCSSARVRLKTARRSRCTPQWRTRNSPEKEGPNDYHEPRADASRQVEGASCVSFAPLLFIILHLHKGAHVCDYSFGRAANASAASVARRMCCP